MEARQPTGRARGRPISITPFSERPPSARKFMQTLDNQIYGELARDAEQRGVKVQELIRAVVVPEWIHSKEPTRIQANSSNVANNPAGPSRRVDKTLRR